MWMRALFQLRPIKVTGSIICPKLQHIGRRNHMLQAGTAAESSNNRVNNFKGIFVSVSVRYYLCHRLASGKDIVSLSICNAVTLCVCVCVRCISLDGVGNALYLVLSSGCSMSAVCVVFVDQPTEWVHCSVSTTEGATCRRKLPSTHSIYTANLSRVASFAACCRWKCFWHEIIPVTGWLWSGFSRAVYIGFLSSFHRMEIEIWSPCDMLYAVNMAFSRHIVILV